MLQYFCNTSARDDERELRVEGSGTICAHSAQEAGLRSESCIKVCFKKRKDTTQQSLYKPIDFSMIFRSMRGTAVSSARTRWPPLGRTSQVQYFVTQPLLTTFFVTTIVWGGVGGACFGCFFLLGLIFFSFLTKVLP